MVGGACVMTGTIPTKTLRESIVYLTGISQRMLYDQSYRLWIPPHTTGGSRCGVGRPWCVWTKVLPTGSGEDRG